MPIGNYGSYAHKVQQDFDILSRFAIAGNEWIYPSEGWVEEGGSIFDGLSLYEFTIQ